MARPCRFPNVVPGFFAVRLVRAAILGVVLAAAPPESLAAACGDAVVDAGEGCDDGNFQRGDGCSPRCQSEVLPDDDQARCVVDLGRSAARLARLRGSLDLRCVKAAAAAPGSGATACLDADADGRVADAVGAVAEAESGSCLVPPPFGAQPAATVSALVLEAERSAITDLFGADPSTSLVQSAADKDGARCQAALAKGTRKLFDASFAAFGRCAREGFAAEGLRSTSDLSACLSMFHDDPKGKVQKVAAKTLALAISACAGADAAALLPGSCGASTTPFAVGRCAQAVARCRACRALRGIHALTHTACDAVDNEALDGSCAADVAPGANLADAARDAGVEMGAAVDVGLSAPREAVVVDHFTSATVENSLKWAELSPSPGAWDFTDGDVAVDWIEAAGLRVRGHTLFWDRFNGRPAWLAADVTGSSDPAVRLEMRMQEHAAEVVGRYAGRIPQWDVVNEPLEALGPDLDASNFFFQVLGESYLDIAFEAAHAADPGALLFLNETLVEGNDDKFDGLVALVRGMLDRGVPVHGVGLQGHFISGTVPYDALVAKIQGLADLGVRVELTEVDLPISLFSTFADPLEAQGDAWAGVVAACLAVPGCTGVTGWGVDDGDTWLDTMSITQPNAPNRPLLFDAAQAPKPAYEAVTAAFQAWTEP